jgi:putative ABC transport system permease protein
VRPRDEDYWKRYRTTPKAFIPLAKGQELWGTRFGKLTSIRLFPAVGEDFAEALAAYRQSLRSVLNPLNSGFTLAAARADGLEAARGATDFGEYFVYFSFFLMLSALLLAGLFFKLGIEQRMREIGTLAALGFAARDIRKLFLIEGAVLSLAGCGAGAAAAIAYGNLMVLGLRTIWSGAVGATPLVLHPDLQALALGSLGGIVAALACILWTLRGLRHATSRGLILGTSATRPAANARIPLALALGGAALMAASAFRALDQTAGFFSAGTLLLAAALWYGWIRLSRGALGTLHDVRQLGLRNAAWKPGRSILCVALIASATFVVVAVDAFRADTGASRDKQGPTGGFTLMAESLLPIVHDPNTAAGREALNLTQPSLRGVRFVPFRLRPGDDASCLNLYQPRDPRVLAASSNFIREGRFAFQESLVKTAAGEANPWLLLEAAPVDGVVPAIADANSMTYVLHRKLGDEIAIGSVRLRLVAALADSVFQGELLISEANFLRVFPDQQGFRYFLLEADPAVTGDLESDLADFGFDVTATRERLAGFHRVENTYIATFQALGALGLLLGTVGLAAVLLRNVLERRRELALLRAVGYRQRNLVAMVLAENALLLVAGLAIGAVCALLAIAPALAARGGGFSVLSIAGLLLAVLVTGMAASLAATIAVARLPVLASLRSE